MIAVQPRSGWPVCSISWPMPPTRRKIAPQSSRPQIGIRLLHAERPPISRNSPPRRPYGIAAPRTRARLDASCPAGPSLLHRRGLCLHASWWLLPSGCYMDEILAHETRPKRRARTRPGRSLVSAWPWSSSSAGLGSGPYLTHSPAKSDGRARYAGPALYLLSKCRFVVSFPLVLP